MTSSIEVIINNLPNDYMKANIIYNLGKLETEEDKEKYSALVTEQYYAGFPNKDYLFYPPLYKTEIDNIHERISYTKHDKVIRHGVKCKYCKGNNTNSQDQQRGGGDEYIPTRVTCFDCHKNYRI